MKRTKLMAGVVLAAAVAAGQGALASDAAAGRGGAPAASPPPGTVAGPAPDSRPAPATRLGCFGGLENGRAILAAEASGGRFGGTTATSCRANGGRALRALRSPAIAVGRPIVG